MLLNYAAVILFSFLCALGLTSVVIFFANKLQLIDVPISRSAHKQPTPAGGGISLVLTYLIAIIYLSSTGELSFSMLSALLAALPVAIVGLTDDFVTLDIRWRLPIQIIAAVWVVYSLGTIPPIGIGPITIQLSAMLDFLAVVALVWMLNLFNFMDGIDGIAASELIFVNLVTLVILLLDYNHVLVVLCCVNIGAAGGFLVWNWNPARVFMGDVGSNFAGFMTGVLALLTIHANIMSVWTWFLLLGVFIIDASYTLSRRVMQGKRWFEGHSCHGYQILARKLNSHAKVTIAVTVTNVIWLAPLALLTLRLPEFGVYFAIVGVIPLLLFLRRLGAGLEESVDS